MIARLIQEHDRIRSLSVTMNTYLLALCPPSDPRFARCRWELMRELSVHLACERRVLASATSAPQGRRRGSEPLDEALRTHMIEWTADAIQRQWPRYREAARALLHRLESSMAYEERVIFPRLR